MKKYKIHLCVSAKFSDETLSIEAESLEAAKKKVLANEGMCEAIRQAYSGGSRNCSVTAVVSKIEEA